MEIKNTALVDRLLKILFVDRVKDIQIILNVLIAKKKTKI